MNHDFRERWTEDLWDWGFGRTSISVYESETELYAWQHWERPYVVVWLHGMHQGPADAGTLRKIQRRLWRRVIFVVPTNPEPTDDGMHFSWGCTFTKKQNKQ
ncbi:rluC, partial [Symbiodinium pilosum]